jgi:hypothetical protein
VVQLRCTAGLLLHNCKGLVPNMGSTRQRFARGVMQKGIEAGDHTGTWQQGAPHNSSNGDSDRMERGGQTQIQRDADTDHTTQQQYGAHSGGKPPHSGSSRT